MKCPLLDYTVRFSGGELAAAYLGFGEPQPTDLHCARDAVPEITTSGFAELLRQACLQFAAQQKAIDHDGNNNHPKGEHDVALEGQVGDEAEENKNQRGEHQELGDIPPGIHVIPNVATGRPLVTEGKVPFVAVLKGAPHAQLLLTPGNAARLPRGLPIIRHERALARGHLNTAPGRRRSLSRSFQAHFLGGGLSGILGNGSVFFSSKHPSRIPARTASESAPLCRL